jgi:hypothetical protein
MNTIIKKKQINDIRQSTTHFLSMLINDQSNPLEVDGKCGDHTSHDAHGGTPQMLTAVAQPIHP